MWLVTHSGLATLGMGTRLPGISLLRYLVMFRLRSMHLAKYRMVSISLKTLRGPAYREHVTQQVKRQVFYVAAACTLIVFMDR